jgi:cytochrome c biogenesis factor
MILKIFKAAWFLSVMAVMVNLLFVYASLPEQVVVQDEGGGRILANREFFFYTLTLLIVFVNVLVYIAGKLFARNEDFRAWFHGLVITINIFFILAMRVIQVYNSAERFDFSRVGFIIYASLALMICWAMSWPFYALYRRFFPKQIVV